MEKIYAAIDLKSFYASVECVARGLDPLTTNLVVADSSRTDKTICLAVSPALKSFGIPGRPRLFEVIAKVREINMNRQQKAPHNKLTGSSANINELSKDPSLAVDFLTATPRMHHYMEISSKIYSIYLNHISADDIQVYSIDEVFIDLTDYVKTHKKSAHDLTMQLIREVLQETGITATAGIGTNLYLAKVAMDIEAKHSLPDENGVRIAELDEISYREKLWGHRPITDFWRVGRGYAKRLAEKGLYTMGDIAKCSLGGKEDYYSEDLLYDLFGINAELLIDHAWGWEPTTIADIKSYKSDNNSVSSGQVLSCPYTFEDAKIIVREMTDDLALSLVAKGLVCDQAVLSINYDNQSLSDPNLSRKYSGPVKKDYYGRLAPKPAHGSENIGRFTSSARLLTDAMMKLYDRIVDPELLIRHIYVIFNHVYPKNEVSENTQSVQLDLFTDYRALEEKENKIQKRLEKETRLQQSILDLQKKYGKNAVLKGMNLQSKAKQKERNEQIGGHKS
ncbi:MAG: hypothetical protein IJI41_07635 [Anaerolineaceae bacterium]|nr:hypothetical protein [Anaerolineaceae bacterium]